MRIESTGCQIGGLDRTRLPAAKWRLRLLRRRWLIPKRWEARANGKLRGVRINVRGRRRRKTVRVNWIRIEQSRRLRVPAALSISLAQIALC